MKKHTYGFTIVELLIVIVVVGVLTAISVIAYTNLQNRARAAAIQSDLTNAMKQLKLYRVTAPEYPNSPTQPQAVGITASKDMYDMKPSGGAANLYYCLNRATDEVILSARTTGDKDAFFITSSGSLTKFTPPANLSGTPTCQTIGLTGSTDANAYYTYGYLPDGGWQSWVK